MKPTVRWRIDWRYWGGTVTTQGGHTISALRPSGEIMNDQDVIGKFYTVHGIDIRHGALLAIGPHQGPLSTAIVN